MEKSYTIIADYCLTLPESRLSQYVRARAHKSTRTQRWQPRAVMTPNVISWTISWHAVGVDVMGLFIKRSSICARPPSLPPSWSPTQRRERSARRQRSPAIRRESAPLMHNHRAEYSATRGVSLKDSSLFYYVGEIGKHLTDPLDLLWLSSKVSDCKGR